MQKLFTILLLNLLVTFQSFSHSSLWNRQATQKGTFMVGADPTYAGGTAKAGVFLKNNILVGASAEVHDLFAMRKEAGLFARKYINSNRFMVYIYNRVFLTVHLKVRILI